MYKGYLIDLDGTAYHGTKVVKETLEFVKALQKRDVDNIYKICLVACKQKRGLRRMKTFANFVLNL